MAYLKGSCTLACMAYSGYRAAASSAVQLFASAFGLGVIWPVWGSCASLHLVRAGHWAALAGEVRTWAVVPVRGRV